MTAFTREFYIPQGGKLTHNMEGMEIYYYQSKFPCLVAFQGRAGKPYAKFSFQTEQRREDYAQSLLASHLKRSAAKKARQAERKAFRHTLKVGDILHSSWGYDQTNVDFYQVIEAREKTVLIRSIRKESVGATGMDCDRVKACPGDFVESQEPMLKKPGHNNTVNINGYTWASPCGPEETFHRSWYA